jgi:Domain of unknown function (DUF4365)
MVFQEVDQSNDYGKDAYVDLTVDGEISGHVIALQIKGGSKYVRASGNAIPCDADHAGLWLNSSIPVIGIVQDPRGGGLYWENLTKYLRAADSSPAAIPVPSSQPLADHSLGSFVDEMVRYLRSYSGSRWLDLASSDPKRQVGAALDCFAIGRFDSRGLILLRAVITRFSGDGLRAAAYLLAHVTPHPDIFFRHDHNWIPDSIQEEVRSTLIWQPSELRQLLGKVAEIEDEETWGRGTVGQSLYHLFVEDPAINGKLEQALRDAVLNWEDEVALQLFFLAVYRAEDPRGYLAELASRFPRLLKDPRAREIKMVVEEEGWIDIF